MGAGLIAAMIAVTSLPHFGSLGVGLAPSQGFYRSALEAPIPCPQCVLYSNLSRFRTAP
jgi:hypothetical protein